MWPNGCSRSCSVPKTEKQIQIERAESEVKALENLLENAKYRLEQLRKEE